MTRYAAVDIGSNSIRMNVAEVTAGGAPRLLATQRDVARLGDSVFRTGALSPEATDLLCAILSRMRGVWEPLGISRGRAVATAALREARNRAEVVARASTALGIPIEIISGEEEARLIRLGVRAGKRSLIIDIGGGSTEIILEDRAWSLPLGAIRLQARFMRSDPPEAAELRALEEFIADEVGRVVRELAGVTVEGAIGTSATARAVVSAADPGTTDRVLAFYRAVCRLDLAGRRRIDGVGPQRAEIIIPGTAVLLHLLEALGLPGVIYSPAGVRDGIIADLAAFGT
jgi:exopolyphosphatase/guanosine-5'-triphosphate,3'-diphosphate pyrophosphatase